MNRLVSALRRPSAPASRRDAEGSRRLQRRVARLERRVDEVEDELRTRLRELDAGLQEQRGLNQRIAVLGDFVAEVVSASARGDDDGLEIALARYSDGL
jgi:hypothetical protein